MLLEMLNDLVILAQELPPPGDPAWDNVSGEARVGGVSCIRLTPWTDCLRLF